MILTLFILTAISLLLFYNIDYKYYKKHGEWDERGVYGPFMGLYMAAVTFVFAVVLLIDKYLG